MLCIQIKISVLFKKCSKKNLDESKTIFVRKPSYLLQMENITFREQLLISALSQKLELQERTDSYILIQLIEYT